MAAHKHAGELLWTEEPYVQVLDDALIQNMQRSTLIPFWKPSFFGTNGDSVVPPAFERSRHAAGTQSCEARSLD